MRYEILLTGVPKDRHSIIVEANNAYTAIFRAGIVLGKALKRGSIRLDPDKVHVTSVTRTDKPIDDRYVPHNT